MTLPSKLCDAIRALVTECGSILSAEARAVANGQGSSGVLKPEQAGEVDTPENLKKWVVVCLAEALKKEPEDLSSDDIRFSGLLKEVARQFRAAQEGYAGIAKEVSAGLEAATTAAPTGLAAEVMQYAQQRAALGCSPSP